MASALRRLMQRGISSAATAAVRASPTATVAARDTQQLELLLEKSVARCDVSRALAAFDKLQTDNGYKVTLDVQLLQRLALLVAKRGRPQEALRAAQILQYVLRQAPHFQADDRTQLAVIYTLDACLQQQMQPPRRGLEDALLLYAAASKNDVLLDLPAIDALLQALVDARRVDEAVALLNTVVAQHDNVRPTEQTYEAILVAMMQQKRYEDVMEVIEHGRAHGVAFSPEVRGEGDR